VILIASLAHKKQQHCYVKEFNRNAVRNLIDSVKSVTTIASKLGIEQSNLHKWNKRYRHEFVSHPSDSTEIHSNELISLKKEIVEIKATVETLRNIILKSLGDKYLQ
jgi:transposase-like protein